MEYIYIYISIAVVEKPVKLNTQQGFWNHKALKTANHIAEQPQCGK